jgi:type III secretion protein C
MGLAMKSSKKVSLAFFVLLLLFSLSSDLQAKESQKELSVKTILPSSAQEGKKESPLHALLHPPSSAKQPTYTINFKNVVMVEYVRFVSKICNVNFLFEEGDLQFPVTIVSEEPITPSRILSILIQVLRIHNLSLLEENNNLVIHKNSEVKGAAPLALEGKPVDLSIPIVTRIFRIQNSKPETIASLIRPMLSTSALIEVAFETKQLLISDVPDNIEKIAEIIRMIDTTHSIYEVEVYQSKQGHSDNLLLVDLTRQLMAPMIGDTPLLLLPQPATSSIYIVSTPLLIQKAIAILNSLENASKLDAKLSLRNENIFIYKIRNRSDKDIESALSSITKNLQESGFGSSELVTTLSSSKFIPETNSILFLGNPSTLSKIQEMLSSIDTLSGEALSGDGAFFFTYKPQHQRVDIVQTALKEISENLKGSPLADKNLLTTINQSKLIQATGSLLFSGDKQTIARIKELLASIDLDVPLTVRQLGKNSFFIYKIQNAPYDEILTSLKFLTDNLKSAGIANDQLLEAIRNVRYITETNSLLFISDAGTLKDLQGLLPSFDLDLASKHLVSGQFLAYLPKNIAGERLYHLMLDVKKNLEEANLTNPSLLLAIQSMKWVSSANTLIFTGNDSSLKQIDSLLKSIDLPSEPGKEYNFFLYHPQAAKKMSIEQYLINFSKQLSTTDLADRDLISTLQNMKWMEDSQSFLFSGQQTSLNRVKEILQDFENTTKKAATEKGAYFLYKLQNVSGNIVEEDLDNFLSKLKTQQIENPSLVKVIENIKWVKETNALLLAGDATAIEEAKQLIAQYDVVRKSELPPHTQFFMYEPKFATAATIESSLKDIAGNLEKAHLADLDLLASIHSLKLVESTNSLVFTGTEASLAKIEQLLKSIDIPKVSGGKVTIWVYKLKTSSPQQITAALASIATDLNKSGTPDKEFIDALTSAKYDAQTLSLFFTGTPEALDKVKPFVERFDLPNGDEVAKPSSFFIYKPQFLAGPVLEGILKEFANNLQNAGFSNRALFNAIQSVKWAENTKSLVFTGDEKSITEVKSLLASFDVPTQGEGAIRESIEPIDNTSFLVYKLQYHKGDEIQGALHQIASDLIKSNANVKESLLSAINSIQWIQVTNSLLCSGDQETMTRLRELIKNLDVPLKQVFVEMLVIETTLANLMDFGLDWGSHLKYKDKFSGSLSNFPPGVGGGSAGFPQNLNNLTPANPPTPQLLPFTPGFDLGVIGDIIMHKGKSYLSLGSLISALQQDTETSIVMTPKILTQDSKTSTLFIGKNIPFIGSAVTTAGQTTSAATNIEYRDIGMNLSLTPFLGNTDTVTLAINMENSAAPTTSSGSIVTLNTTNINGITTSKTTMNTTVHIPNRNFLILSGMALETKTRSKTGIPCLGGLPWLGVAFSDTQKNQSRDNLVIFIRPHIINSYQDMKILSENQEDYFREHTGTHGLERDYDESIDSFKAYEEEEEEVAE